MLAWNLVVLSHYIKKFSIFALSSLKSSQYCDISISLAGTHTAHLLALDGDERMRLADSARRQLIPIDPPV